MLNLVVAVLATFSGVQHHHRSPLWTARWNRRWDQQWNRHWNVRFNRRWRAAHPAATPSMSYAVASWYDDTGTTASGWHAQYGVANLSLAFGTKVLFEYHGQRVEAIVDDRGPYVYGRTWDLSQNTAGALGFSGVDTVAYHVGG